MPHIRRASRRTALLPVVTLLLAGAVTACGGGGAESGERLRVSMAFPPVQGMSPYGDDAVTLSRLAVVEGLTALDRNGEAQPALASSWKPSDAGRTWTFELRPARFQDGTEVTAESVVRSLEKAGDASPAPRVLSDAGEWKATAEDDGTVRITSSRPDGLLPQRLANPSLAILSEDAYGRNEDGRADPAGHATGPFTLTRLHGTAGATLERNDGYWGGKAKAPGIDVKFVADGTARANALRSGQTDIAEAVPVSQASVLDEAQVHEVPTARTNSLYLNTGSGPFADAGVRAAAREAIDSKALVDGVYEGRADTPKGLFGPGIRWAAAERRAADTKSAKTEAVSEADVRRAGKVKLATYTNRPELPEVASALEQQLKKKGFRVEQVVRDYAQMESDALDGAFDAFILPRNTLLDSGDPLTYLQSDVSCDGSYNIAQLCDQDVESAVEKAARTTDADDRRAAEIQAEAQVLQTDAVLPLLHERFVQGVSEDVQGIALDPMERRLVTADTRRG